MTATVVGFLTTLFTDPVYGIPLVLWVSIAIVWLYLGRGTAAPVLLPYHIPRARARDPVSAMYWSLRERRYSETVLFVYQRLSGAFQRRYEIGITQIPWRRSVQRRLGLEDPRPYRKVVQRMVQALNVATALENPTGLRAIWELLRSWRERRLMRYLDEILTTVEWMVPYLEAGG
jgi:hypothetical protein